MNKVVNRIVEVIKIETELSNNVFESKSNEEDFDWMIKAFGDREVQYMRDKLENEGPAARAAYIKKMKMFAKRAENEKDPLQALYYEYQMYLNPQMAKNMAKKFYQRNIMSGTHSDTFFDDESNMNSTIETSGYGINMVPKGMFSNLGSKSSHPGKTFEIDDFFTKLFNSSLLDRADKLVLVTNLILGIGPNMRAGKRKGGEGIDLQSIMNHPPKELKEIEDRIKDLIKFGLAPENVTKEKILQGMNKNDSDDNTIRINPLVDTKRQQVAMQHIRAAMIKLVGSDDIDKIYDFMNGKVLNPFGAVEESILESKDEDVVETIDKFISGEPVTIRELISAIVLGVNVNIKHHTRLSKSSIFAGSIKDISKRYLKLAKGNEADKSDVQNLFMAPILDEEDPRL